MLWQTFHNCIIKLIEEYVIFVNLKQIYKKCLASSNFYKFILQAFFKASSRSYQQDFLII